MKIEEYKDTDGFRRWELLYEGFHLVLLSESAPLPYANELLAFKDLKLIWCLPPNTKESFDHIVNIWVKDSELWAGSFSGFNNKINYKTGAVIETLFTK